ncbi:MAG: universal stress protein [Bacteroidales bacterium]
MAKELERVLVPIDFKGSSVKALEHASNLCIEKNGTLELLHVIETSGVLNEFFSSGDYLVKVTDKAKEKMLELTQDIKKKLPALRIETTIERGKAYQKILEVTKRTRPDLLVMGENHQGNNEKKHLGSSVYHATLHSTSPVLTLKGDNPKPDYDKIVVPLDLTKDIKWKISSAIYYGKTYQGEIHLVSALVGGVKMENSRIYKKLKEAQQTLLKNGVKSRVKLFDRSEVPPYKRVLQYMDKEKPDMVLIMTHQEGYTYNNYIGAFAHHIINESKVPVLSLTSSVTKRQYNQVVASMIDPAGIFTR